jgi:phage gpG-like protein
MSGFGGEHPILVRTRELFNKVTKTRGKITLTTDGAKITWGDYDGWGGADKYAIHQIGAQTPRGNIPARPMIGATAADRQHLTDSYYGYMGAIIRYR